MPMLNFDSMASKGKKKKKSFGRKSSPKFGENVEDATPGATRVNKWLVGRHLLQAIISFEPIKVWRIS